MDSIYVEIKKKKLSQASEIIQFRSTSLLKNNLFNIMYEHTYEKENAHPMFMLNGNNNFALKLSLTPESSFDKEIVGCTVVVCEQYSMWTYPTELIFRTLTGGSSYSSSEVPSVYSIALADWAINIVIVKTVIFQIIQFSISPQFRC